MGKFTMIHTHIHKTCIIFAWSQNSCLHIVHTDFISWDSHIFIWICIGIYIIFNYIVRHKPFFFFRSHQPWRKLGLDINLIARAFGCKETCYFIIMTAPSWGLTFLLGGTCDWYSLLKMCRCVFCPPAMPSATCRALLGPALVMNSIFYCFLLLQPLHFPNTIAKILVPNLWALLCKIFQLSWDGGLLTLRVEVLSTMGSSSTLGYGARQWSEDEGSKFWSWQDSTLLSPTSKQMPKTSTPFPLEAIRADPLLPLLEVTGRPSYHSLPPPYPDPNAHPSLDAPNRTPFPKPACFLVLFFWTL